MKALSISAGFNMYGFLIGAAIVICCIAAHFIAKKRNTYYNDIVFDIAIAAVPPAVIGARVYYVLYYNSEHPGYYDFWGAFKIWEGGLAIYGAVIGAIIGIIILYFVRRNKPDSVTIMQMFDLGAPFLMLGQAIGRWGNFFNKEAYGQYIGGKNSSFFPIGVWIENGYNGTGYYQATFFYESFLNMIGFCVLLWILAGRRKSFDGCVYVGYCLWYGVVRFIVESMRSDSLMWGSFRASQIVSLIFIVAGLSELFYYLYRARKAGLKPMLFVPQNRLSELYYGVHPNLLPKEFDSAD